MPRSAAARVGRTQDERHVALPDRDGRQLRSLNRTRLPEIELPVDWMAQEALLGFAA